MCLNYSLPLHSWEQIAYLADSAYASGEMSSTLSVLSRIKTVLERPKEVKSHLKFFRSILRARKANKLQKEVPDGGVPAPSEQLPSEADSLGVLRQNDLAVIRSEEL